MDQRAERLACGEHSAFCRDDDAHQYAVRLQQMIQQLTVEIGDRS